MAPFRQPYEVQREDGWAEVWGINEDGYGHEAMIPVMHGLDDTPIPPLPDWAAAPSLVEAFILKWGFVPVYRGYAARFAKKGAGK